jgi:hypothetical protein
MEDATVIINDYELAIVYKLFELVETYASCIKEKNLATYYKLVLVSICKNNTFVDPVKENDLSILEQLFRFDNNNQIALLILMASDYIDMYPFTQHAYFTCQVIIAEAIEKLVVKI